MPAFCRGGEGAEELGPAADTGPMSHTGAHTCTPGQACRDSNVYGHVGTLETRRCGTPQQPEPWWGLCPLSQGHARHKAVGTVTVGVAGGQEVAGVLSSLPGAGLGLVALRELLPQFPPQTAQPVWGPPVSLTTCLRLQDEATLGLALPEQPQRGWSGKRHQAPGLT